MWRKEAMRVYYEEDREPFTEPDSPSEPNREEAE